MGALRTASRARQRRKALMPRFQRVGLMIAAWTGVAIIFGLILRVQIDIPLPYAFGSSFGWYYPLGVLVWIACALDVRLALWKRSLPSALMIHGAIAIIALTVWAALIVGWSRVSVGPDYWEKVF